MSDHDEPLVRVVADLKAELAEFRANANKVTESMGSEIMRLQGELESARAEALRVGKDFCATAAELATTRAELEQQRTRAEAAEQEAAELAGVIRDVSAMLAQAQEMLA